MWYNYQRTCYYAILSFTPPEDKSTYKIDVVYDAVSIGGILKGHSNRAENGSYLKNIQYVPRCNKAFYKLYKGPDILYNALE